VKTKYVEGSTHFLLYDFKILKFETTARPAHGCRPVLNIVQMDRYQTLIQRVLKIREKIIFFNYISELSDMYYTNVRHS
jgi:hypothetical protein